jgi:hypothetical protein
VEHDLDIELAGIVGEDLGPDGEQQRRGQCCLLGMEMEEPFSKRKPSGSTWPTTRVVWTKTETTWSGNTIEWGTSNPGPSSATKQLSVAGLGLIPEFPW